MALREDEGCPGADRQLLALLAALVHRSFVNGLAIAMRDRNQLDPCHALQTQFCAPSPHREDEIQGDELARLRGRSSPTWQPDIMGNAGSTGGMACSSAQDTRWPAPVVRSRHRNGADTGLRLRNAAAPDRGVYELGA
jgi:hypothetical protein